MKEIKYHILGSYLGDISIVNEFKTLKAAMVVGEALLEYHRNIMYDDHEWDDGAFGIKIFDSDGHIYYISVKSGYQSGRDYMKQYECEDCELYKTRDCRPLTCEELSGSDYDEYIDDIVFLQCNKELNSRELEWFLDELEFEKGEREAWIKEKKGDLK